MSNTDLYLEIFESAVYAAAEHCAQSEDKHGVGIKVSDDDINKCLTHAARSITGEVNPDGASHAVAALVRALKAVLNEQYGVLTRDQNQAGL